MRFEWIKTTQTLGVSQKQESGKSSVMLIDSFQLMTNDFSALEQSPSFQATFLLCSLKSFYPWGFPKSVDCHRVWRWYSDTPSLKIHRARRPVSMHKEFAYPKNTTPWWKKTRSPNPSTPSKLIANKSVESNDTIHGKSKLNPFFVCSSSTRNGTTVRYGKCWTGLLRKNLNKLC